MSNDAELTPDAELMEQLQHQADICREQEVHNLSGAPDRDEDSRSYRDAMAWRELRESLSDAADRLAALIAERDRLKEALAPFAAIVPSSIYPDDGSENEGYVVILKRDWGNEQVFTGGDLRRARAALSTTPGDAP